MPTPRRCWHWWRRVPESAGVIDPVVTCHTNAARQLDDLVVTELSRAVGHRSPRHVVIKPNWGLHQTDPRYPIWALVTDARVIAATVRAALMSFPARASPWVTARCSVPIGR